jgi:O-antigen/teichoic acid export membrane protein
MMSSSNSFLHQNLALARSRTAKQTAVLFFSKILTILLAMAAIGLNTRILGPQDYGVLAFFFAFTGLSVLFFRFGLFSSGALLLAQSRDERTERELIGALLSLAFLVGLVYAAFIFLSSFLVDRFFKTDIQDLLRILSPLLIILPFQFLFPQICRGTNRIYRLFWFNILPKIFYVIAILTVLACELLHLGIAELVFINLSAVLITVVILSGTFRPSFRRLRECVSRILAKNREYGIHLYWGQIADQSTYQLDQMFITYFVNTTQLGFYTLAGRITAPLVMLSHSLSTTLFKGFVDRRRIPRKVILFNFLWLSAGVLGLVVLGRFLVNLLFTVRFEPTIGLIPLLALSCFFQGMYQPFGMFMESQGRGKWIRNVSFFSALTNVLGNAALVPRWGAMGAAAATLGGRFTHFSLYLYYYSRFRRESSNGG